MTFPTSLDSLTNPTAGQYTNSPSHSAIHIAENTAIEALETKVGINGSTDANSLDYKINHITPSGGGSTDTSIESRFLPTEVASSDIDNSDYSAFGITGIFPSGKLYIIYRRAGSHVGTNGIMVIQTSVDQGATWSTGVTVKSETGVDIRNYGGGVTSTGRLIVSYIRYDSVGAVGLGQYYIYSDDEGLTWSAAISIPVGTFTDASPYGALIEIGNGEILLPWYGVDGGTYSSFVIKSSDNGATWGSKITAITGTTPNLYTEASFVYLGGNTILGTVRNNTDFSGATQVISTDNGDTWSTIGVTSWEANPGIINSWMSTYIGSSGRRVVECCYANRASSVPGDNGLKIVYGYAEDLIANGVSGWFDNAKVIIDDAITTTSGYPAIVHPFGGAMGLGWYYSDSSLTASVIKFFITEGFEGKWFDWTPTITVAGGTAPTYTANFLSRFRVIGREVSAKIYWFNNSGGTAGAGTGVLTATLPITGQVDILPCIGSGLSYEAAGTIDLVNVELSDATTFILQLGTTAYIKGDDQSSTTRLITASFSYEI